MRPYSLIPCSQLFVLFLAMLASPIAQTVEAQAADPVIDMHLHAKRADELGPPPLYLCAPFTIWPLKDSQENPQAYLLGSRTSPRVPRRCGQGQTTKT